MSSTRSEKVFLSDIIEAAEAIELFITGIKRDEFMLEEIDEANL